MGEDKFKEKEKKNQEILQKLKVNLVRSSTNTKTEREVVPASPTDPSNLPTNQPVTPPKPEPDNTKLLTSNKVVLNLSTLKPKISNPPPLDEIKKAANLPTTVPQQSQNPETQNPQSNNKPITPASESATAHKATSPTLKLEFKKTPSTGAGSTPSPQAQPAPKITSTNKTVSLSFPTKKTEQDKNQTATTDTPPASQDPTPKPVEKPTPATETKPITPLKLQISATSVESTTNIENKITPEQPIEPTPQIPTPEPVKTDIISRTESFNRYTMPEFDDNPFPAFRDNLARLQAMYKPVEAQPVEEPQPVNLLPEPTAEIATPSTPSLDSTTDVNLIPLKPVTAADMTPTEVTDKTEVITQTLQTLNDLQENKTENLNQNIESQPVLIPEPNPVSIEIKPLRPITAADMSESTITDKTDIIARTLQALSDLRQTFNITDGGPSVVQTPPAQNTPELPQPPAVTKPETELLSTYTDHQGNPYERVMTNSFSRFVEPNFDEKPETLNAGGFIDIDPPELSTKPKLMPAKDDELVTGIIQRESSASFARFKPLDFILPDPALHKDPNLTSETFRRFVAPEIETPITVPEPEPVALIPEPSSINPPLPSPTQPVETNESDENTALTYYEEENLIRAKLQGIVLSIKLKPGQLSLFKQGQAGGIAIRKQYKADIEASKLFDETPPSTQEALQTSQPVLHPEPLLQSPADTQKESAFNLIPITPKPIIAPLFRPSDALIIPESAPELIPTVAQTEPNEPLHAILPEPPNDTSTQIQPQQDFILSPPDKPTNNPNPTPNTMHPPQTRPKSGSIMFVDLPAEVLSVSITVDVPNVTADSLHNDKTQTTPTPSPDFQDLFPSNLLNLNPELTEPASQEMTDLLIKVSTATLPTPNLSPEKPEDINFEPALTLIPEITVSELHHTPATPPQTQSSTPTPILPESIQHLTPDINQILPETTQPPSAETYPILPEIPQEITPNVNPLNHENNFDLIPESFNDENSIVDDVSPEITLDQTTIQAEVPEIITEKIDPVAKVGVEDYTISKIVEQFQEKPTVNETIPLDVAESEKALELPVNESQTQINPEPERHLTDLEITLSPIQEEPIVNTLQTTILPARSLDEQKPAPEFNSDENTEELKKTLGLEIMVPLVEVSELVIPEHEALLNHNLTNRLKTFKQSIDKLKVRALPEPAAISLQSIQQRFIEGMLNSIGVTKPAKPSSTEADQPIAGEALMTAAQQDLEQFIQKFKDFEPTIYQSIQELRSNTNQMGAPVTNKLTTFEAPHTPLDTDEDINDEQEEFVTETLAKIFIKQGHLERATSIFRKLMLKFPEKSAYFEAQIAKIKPT